MTSCCLAGQRLERRQVEHAARRVAEQTGRQVEQQFIDQTCAQQRAAEAETGLGVHFVDAAPGEFASRAGRSTCPSGPAAAGLRRRACRSAAILRGSATAAAPDTAIAQHSGVERQFEPAIDDHFQGLTQSPPQPFHPTHIELRIVVADRADAGQDGAGARSPAMPVLPRRRPGQPLAGAILQRRLAVEAGGQLQPQPGPGTRHAGDETDVDFRASAASKPHSASTPACAQAGQPLPGDQRIGILHRGDDARHAGRQQRIGAGRRAAMVTAGLERDVAVAPRAFSASGLQACTSACSRRHAHASLRRRPGRR
jgi:hypothetical protein